MQCKLSILAAAACLLSGTALAAEDPYSQPDESWISISGTVEAVAPNSFTLDYGNGMVVTVEMDDGDRDADAYKLLSGDQVNVVGKIDDDMFETTTIEASSVYVDKLGTTFYASAADEEDVVITVRTPLDLSETLVRGTVESVGDGQFTVDTGTRKLTVTTEGLVYDPLDDEGYLKVEEGDRVSVAGDIDENFFGGPELEADSVIVLEPARDREDAGAS
ncbi:MAG: DUF5666 domain-containing protein [Thiohalocapsa sp.]|nr:DUF5666 domain-containing protein [Thiohalocapsa sp.]MCF7989515.1 DUF5666 domain-containing protein [Thiohalocapsa sp.]